LVADFSPPLAPQQWYSLSYVPYARSLVKNMVSKVLG
jgi:hypothetical protein